MKHSDRQITTEDNNGHSQKKKVAFIDIDGTLIRKMSSERLFCKYLVSKRVITLKDLYRYLKESFKRFLILKGLQFKKNKYYLTGKKIDDILESAKKFFNEKLSPHIPDKFLQEINNLKEKGYMIILLSGTLDPLVECFKNFCKADLGIGTQLVSDNGIITGEIDGTFAYRKGKAVIVKKLQEIYDIDMDRSYAYANQYADVKHMRLVGYPIAVNAGPMLRLYAKINKWYMTNF